VSDSSEDSREPIPKKQSGHAAKQARRRSTIDATSVTIRFSPEVAERFRQLEVAMPEIPSPHHHPTIWFDPDLREQLRELAAGGPVSVGKALSDFSRITEEAMLYIRRVNKHVHLGETKQVYDALDDLQRMLQHDSAVVLGQDAKTRAK
jgi:hypothetical protein